MESKLSTRPHWVVGVDIGGTGIKAVLVDQEGKACARRHRATPVAGGVSQVVEVVAGVVTELAQGAPAGAQVAAVGVAVPGAVDVERGIVLDATNLGWQDVHLVDQLEARLGLPVLLEHDVRAAALAELAYGCGGDFLFITLGTGVGGAVVLSGQAYTGAHHLAGEIGHMVVEPGGPRCVCGKRGCLEAVASASAIVRRVQAAGFPDCLTGEQVAELVAAGEPRAAAVWREATEALGLALANYAVVMDPGRVVIGGGLSGAGEMLLEPVRAAMRRHLGPEYDIPVSVSTLGSAAGQLGAAFGAQRRLAA